MHDLLLKYLVFSAFEQSSLDKDQPRGHRFLACVLESDHLFFSFFFPDRCVPTSACTMEGEGGEEVQENNLGDPLWPNKRGLKQEG